MSQHTTKSTIRPVWPAKTPISIYIHPVWMLDAVEGTCDKRRHWPDCADAQADRTSLIVGFVIRWLVICNISYLHTNLSRVCGECIFLAIHCTIKTVDSEPCWEVSLHHMTCAKLFRQILCENYFEKKNKNKKLEFCYRAYDLFRYVQLCNFYNVYCNWFSCS